MSASCGRAVVRRIASRKLARAPDGRWRRGKKIRSGAEIHPPWMDARRGKRQVAKVCCRGRGEEIRPLRALECERRLMLFVDPYPGAMFLHQSPVKFRRALSGSISVERAVAHRRLQISPGEFVQGGTCCCFIHGL